MLMKGGSECMNGGGLEGECVYWGLTKDKAHVKIDRNVLQQKRGTVS